MDAFVSIMRDLSISSYTTQNQLGVTVNVPSTDGLYTSVNVGVMGVVEHCLVNEELITGGGAGQINIPIKVKALEDIVILRYMGLVK